MDPLTLFALANGAVSAVKAGCKLYKDIKSAAGDVKDVLKDLDKQFHDHYHGKPIPPEAKKQLVQEKNRVIELNKKSDDTTGIYSEIGEHLGTYYDNYYKCIAIFEEEERRSKTEIYTGDASLGKRALQRVLMKKQLEQMGNELQQLMIYQSPPELGALWTEVNAMMKKLGAEQKILITKQMQIQAVQDRRRAARIKKLHIELAIGVAIIFTIFVMAAMFMWVAYDRQQKYPNLGSELFPKSERQRQYESQKHVYVGR
jgi:hypothetical protein